MNATKLTICALLLAAPGCSQNRATFDAETDARNATAFPTTGPLTDAYDAFAQNRYRNVIIACDSAALRDEQNAEARMLRGVAYCVTDDIYNGIEDIAAAIRLNPAYQQHDKPVDRAHDYYIDAVVKLDTTSILKPRYADAFVGQALDALRMDDPTQALRCCHEAITLSPAHARAYAVSGDALLAKNDIEQAVRVYQKAADLEPSRVRTIADTLQRRANVEKAAGNDAGAARCRQAAEQIRQ